MADTGGLRNEKSLTEEQKCQVIEYAVSLGMPENRIRFLEHAPTAYWDDLDALTVGTDVLPLRERSNNPNSNVSLRGTIAHEIVGHREAVIKGIAQPIEVLEEAQASIRAARFAPELSPQERTDLLKDGISRLRKRGIALKSVKHKLHINER